MKFQFEDLVLLLGLLGIIFAFIWLGTGGLK